METNDFRILNALYSVAMGDFINITPLLLQMYPINEEHIFSKITQAQNIKAFLKILKSNSLIDCLPYNIGLQRDIVEGYIPNIDEVAWLDTVEIFATILPQGRALVEREKDKIENERVRQSALLTEQSVRDTNDLTRSNLLTQERTQETTRKVAVASVWVASISGFIALLSFGTSVYSVYQSSKDSTADKLNAVVLQMQKDKKAFDSINSNLTELHQVTKKRKSDTTKIEIVKTPL